MTDRVTESYATSSYVYDPPAFWQDPADPSIFGPWDPSRPSTSSPVHTAQEEALADVLASVRPGHRRFVPKAIFEAGCGYGRLALFFKRTFPEASYTAVDLGAAQLSSVRQFRPDATLFQADFLDFPVRDLYEDPAEPSSDPSSTPAPSQPFEGFDLVMASEFLMHVRPTDVRKAITMLLHLTKPGGGLLVTVDWVPVKGELTRLRKTNSSTIAPTGVAPWNFPHPYARLITKAGGDILRMVRTNRQVIHVIQP